MAGMRDEDIPAGECSERWWKECLCPALCLPCNPLFHRCRKAVSGPKRRWEQDGFDLDLTYTSPDKRIITMGFPATGIEHLYRNPRSEIKRFLDLHHGEHYKVFNLCCEPGRGYPRSLFGGRVERYPMRDHCVPTLDAMYELTNSAKAWLDADPSNVVALHCKAGKGRAGVATCMVLTRLGTFPSAAAAMDYYDETRVDNRKGLTVKSQRKYVTVFEKLWREHWGVQGNLGDVPAEDVPLTVRQLPEQPERTIVAVRLVDVGANVTVNQSFVCRVLQGTSFAPELVSQTRLSAETRTLDPDAHVWRMRATVRGNFSIMIRTRVRCGTKPFKFCDMWENTAFVEPNTYMVSFGFGELDLKKRFRRVVSQGVRLEIFFEDPASSDGLPNSLKHTPSMSPRPPARPSGGDGGGGGALELTEVGTVIC